MKPSLDGYDDEEALAAEYVLGLLSVAETEEAERRAASDRAFRTEVASWRERLAPLAASAVPVNPPARVKKALDTRLFAQKGSSASSLSGFVIGIFTAVAIAAAAMIIFFPPSGVALVAEATSSDSRIAVVARGDGDRLSVSVRSGAPAEGRVLQLWVVNRDGHSVSLGTLPPSGEGAIDLGSREAAFVVPGAVFAVSEELAGGSTTGQPGGPFVAAGTFVRE